MNGIRLGAINRLARACSAHPGWVLLAWLFVMLAAGMAGWTSRDAFSSAVLTGDASSPDASQRWAAERPQPGDRNLVCASDYARGGQRPGRDQWVDLDSSTAAQLSQQAGQCYMAMWEGQDAVTSPVPVLGDVATASPGGSAATPASLPLISPAFLESWQTNAGSGSRSVTIGDVVHSDIVRAERIALPLTLLVLIFALRNPVLAMLPLLSGAAVSLVAFGILTMLARSFTISVHVLSIMTMLGLALGIDYALLWVMQAKRRNARDGPGSTNVTILMAGTVVFGASLGLLAMPLSIFRDVVLGIAIVVLVAMLAATTLVPALAHILPGEEPDRFHALHFSLPRAIRPGNWRWPWKVPWICLLAVPAFAILIGLGWEATTLRTAITLQAPVAVTDQASPAGPYDSYMQGALLEVRLSSVDVVVSGDQDDMSRDALLAFIGGDVDFAPLVIVDIFPANDITVLHALVVRPADSAIASGAIDRLHHFASEIQVGNPDTSVVFGGPLETYQRVITAIEGRQVVTGLIAVSIAGVLMTVLIGMPLVSLVAVGGSLLSFVAALGALVLIVQHGVSLLGVEQAPHIESWVPIVMFCVLLGMGIDYHMFLMGGVLDALSGGTPPGVAMAEGYRTVGPVVIAAALTMMLVFGGFVRGEIVAMQQLGIGLACGVALDAFLVRLLLVPSLIVVADRSGLHPLVRHGWLAWRHGPSARD